MGQTYTSNCFVSSEAAQTNMANIEVNFATLRSGNSGASAPSNTEAGLYWFDTTKNRPKVRNDADSAWHALLTGDASQKFWIYRNTAMDGWVIDATVTDRVLSLKGGSGLYNANGGTNAGETWANLKAHTHTRAAHNHQWYNVESGNDESYDINGAEKNMEKAADTGSGLYALGTATGSFANYLAHDCYTDLDGDSNTGAQSTADVRPAAAIGTLQYPDI